MTQEITIEETAVCADILAEKNELGFVMLWQDDSSILVDRDQIPGLIAALTQLSKQP